MVAPAVGANGIAAAKSAPIVTTVILEIHRSDGRTVPESYLGAAAARARRPAGRTPSMAPRPLRVLVGPAGSVSSVRVFRRLSSSHRGWRAPADDPASPDRRPGPVLRRGVGTAERRSL